MLVTHSKLSTRLSFLTMFLWFIWGLFSGFGMKVFATSRWTAIVNDFLSIAKHTTGYPWQIDCPMNFCFFSDHTWPVLVTEYSPCVPGIGCFCSIIALTSLAFYGGGHANNRLRIKFYHNKISGFNQVWRNPVAWPLASAALPSPWFPSAGFRIGQVTRRRLAIP